MEQIYAVRSAEDFTEYEAISHRMLPKLESFLSFLEQNFHVTDLPRAIVWTDQETASRLLSDIPLPAYTNEYRVMFCPDLDVWKELYLRQLEQKDDPTVREYYQNQLSEQHILQILGHEFVHHSDLFLEDFDGSYDQGIWFEEGMCEYISHKFFLSEEQFRESVAISERLTALFERGNGTTSLEAFGSASYDGSCAGIFYEYHLSFLAVKELVDQRHGDVLKVFQDYHCWADHSIGQTLSQFFRLEA